MHTLICAGGSGMRVLEATLHLCAAGLGPDLLRILVIDPDKAGGNFTRVKLLLEKYVQCHEAFAGKLGEDLNLFGTKLDLLDANGGETGLKIWTPVQPDQKLKDLLNYEGLSATNTSPDIARLFFTEDELQEELGHGFRGHPAIGAAAFSLVSLHAQSQPWKQVIDKLTNDIAQPSGARVFLVGSVFGGTGASAIHPIVRFLRTIPEINPERLKIGVAALVPYFGFNPGTVAPVPDTFKLAARSEWFPLSTRSAVEFYQHLRENRDWQFDAVYWIGDNGFMEVQYQPGGPHQRNPAHFVDVLAAFCCIEFFAHPTSTEACYWAGPRQKEQPPPEEKNLLDWLDLPFSHFVRKDVRLKLLRFFLTGAVHLGFGHPLLKEEAIDKESFCVPWYFERFSSRGESLRSRAEHDALELLSHFFAMYHFPWWEQILRLEATSVRMFNRAAFQPGADGSVTVDLTRLANLEWPDRPGEANLDQVDAFFTDMVEEAPEPRGGTRGAPAYLSLLAHAADRYVTRTYAKSAVLEA